MVLARQNSITSLARRISILATALFTGSLLLFPAAAYAESLPVEVPVATAIEESVIETDTSETLPYECPTSLLQADVLSARVLSEPLLTDCEPSQSATPVIDNSISGYVFEDYNGNRSYDNTESKLENWRVSLYDQEPDWTDIWKYQVATTLTSPNGYYGFGDLPPKDYWLCEIVQNGWMQTVPHYSEQGHCYVFTFYTTNEHKEFNFGNTRFATLVVTKFEDANGNRYFDDTENTLNDWEITVDGYAHLTMNNGTATIPYLRPGSEYVLNENQQTGWDKTALYCSNGTHQYEWNGLKLFPVSNEVLHCFVGNKRIQMSGTGGGSPNAPTVPAPVIAPSSSQTASKNTSPRTLAVTGEEQSAVQYIAAVLLLVSLATAIRSRQPNATTESA